MAEAVKVDGLADLVKVLKGPAFRDVNRALRAAARSIADDLAPHIAAGVRASAAPQADALAATIRTKPDRVPVVVLGKVNPKFKSAAFTRKGSDSKRRRGAMAHGVVYGPKGGKKSTRVRENYYRISRSDSGGALGRSLKNGRAVRAAEIAYLKAYLQILGDAGLEVKQ